MERSITMLSRRRLVQGALAFTMLLGSGRSGYAAGVRERHARELVSGLVEHILQVIGADERRAGRDARLMTAIESQTDLGLLARMTLGRHWRRASEPQRRLFVQVYRRYLLQSFISRLRRYVGADLGTAGDRFTITATQSVGKNDLLVRSRITPPSGAPLSVDWRLRSRDERLFILDLIVEDVSLLITQRSEFGSVVERIGVDGLIGELRNRISHPS